MARAVSSQLYDFAKFHPEAEGVIQHLGRRTWDLVLIDHTGLWVREEFASAESAEEACRRLKLRIVKGWDDIRMARWMNARDHWGTPDGQRRAL
ncbi:MAG: hypothetical protein QOI81_888 [Actinomycetota bacterium]|jgi:hypothetical protein|nr:hypothetical protein [Actinomycetota bacterium]